MDINDPARLEQILSGLFRLAREAQQAAGREKPGSERKPAQQVPHLLDLAIDTICKDFGLKNPGTDGHSLNCWPHPADGWPPETLERMRRQRVRMAMERGVVGRDEEWLNKEGLTLAKSGWVRDFESSPEQEDRLAH